MGKSLSIPDMYNDPYFNPLIDISCSYPVVIMPIYNESNEIVSVVEYTNIKCIARRAEALKRETQQAALNNVDLEMMNHYAKVLSMTLTKYLKKDILKEGVV